MLARTGRPAEAGAEYRKALAIYEKLVQENPTNTEYRRRLGMVYNNLGGLLLNVAGRLPEAEAAFRTAMQIKQQIADDNPAVTDLRNDVALSQRNLGEVLSQMGRAAESQSEFQKSIAIYQKLAEDNPTLSEFRGNLADGHSALAMVLYQTGRTAEAQVEFLRALVLRQKLAEENPAVSKLQSDLARSRHNLGYMLAESGKALEAEAEYRRSMAIYQGLVDRDPSVTGFRASSRTTSWTLASYSSRPDARPRRNRCNVEPSPCMKTSSRRTPGSPLIESAWRVRCTTWATWCECSAGPPRHAQITTVRSPFRRSWCKELKPVVPGPAGPLVTETRTGLARPGQPRRHAADTQHALTLYDGIKARAGEEWFETACCHAALAGLATQPASGLSASEADEHAALAMSLLHKAVNLGYRNTGAIRMEAALEPLRGSDGFRALIMDLSFPPVPFAHQE